MFDFNGKVLVLSGANGSITRNIAKTFYNLGASMVLSDLNEAGLTEFANELDPDRKRVHTMKVDVRKEADCNAVGSKVKELFGYADFLVTGAGLYRDQLVESMSEEQWQESIGINLDGVFFF